MKVLATCLLALGLLAGTTAMAAEGKDKGAAAPANSPTLENSAANSAATPAAPATPAEERMEEELQELRDLLVTQGKQFQEQNKQLKEQFKEQQQKVQSLEEELSIAKAGRENLASPEPDAVAANPAIGPTPHGGTLSAGNSGNGGNSGSGQDGGDAPASIHIKGITLTPGGFMEGAAVWCGQRKKGILELGLRQPWSPHRLC